MIRAILAAATILLAAITAPAAARNKPAATLYKNPECSCCEGYAAYLRRNGFDVKVVATHDMPLLKKQHSVPEPFEGCHTTLVGGYVVEGHVPVNTLKKLLSERPRIPGVSLPGMPAGSPGMTGVKSEPFTIYELGSDPNKPRIYAVE